MVLVQNNKGEEMELLAKLQAAADMCESGDEINLDEMAFLIRYAIEELNEAPEKIEERNRLVENLRKRLIARCDLLNATESETECAEKGDLKELEELEERLDKELRNKFFRAEGQEKNKRQ